MSKFSIIFIRFIIIVISVVLINNLIITTVDTTRNEYKIDTSVGNVYLGGLHKTSVDQFLEPQVNNYLNKLELKFNYNNQVYSSQVDFVEYDHELTLSSIKDGGKSDLALTINTNKLKLLLSKNLPKYIFNNIDYNELTAYLKNEYISLHSKVDIYIMDYITDFDSLKEELNTYTYFIDDVDDLIKDLEEIDIVIEPNSRFSILDTLRFKNFSSDELNILATGINAVVIETNFSSFIKSNSRIPYTKVNHDIEALETSISKTQDKDFSFYNPYDYSYEILIDEVNGGLKFTLIGIPFVVEYGYLIEEENIKFIPLSDNVIVPEGATLINGVDGKEIKVYRYILTDGVIENKELIYTNYFGPRNETYEE
ncbi:hypothetical protein RJG79_05575 [Mycoplasmatota bacterium WC44]